MCSTEIFNKVFVPFLYGSGGAVVLLRQSLQQQNRMKRQTRVAQIIAPGEVKIQWLNVTSLASS
jgi:hypothetical protein